MHELAIAQNIIDVICEQVTEDFKKVNAINLEVGTFSGIVSDSLDFNLKVLMEEKSNSNVVINILEKPSLALCECGKKYEIKNIFESCPYCGSQKRELISGMDIIIKSIEIEEP
jgi:hydrogenase nickel incorporation protein HypA/HybF